MRTKITLACTECKQRNYNTTKDKKAHPDRMETKKYCRFCRTHTLHKETKQLDVDRWFALRTGSLKGVSMGDSANTEKTKKPGFFKGVKSEFKKITWPDKKSLLKQTVAVVLTTIVLGVLIAVFDFVIQYGVEFITTL